MDSRIKFGLSQLQRADFQEASTPCCSELCTPASQVTIPVMPPADEWEDRSGPHFGFRASASTTTTERTAGGLFRGSRTETKQEPYWPGMWIHFRSKTNRGVEEDSAYIKVRGNRSGRDFKVMEIEEFGWWTFGMSFTPDGMVHFFASPGVDNLTAADHLTSQYPYSFRAERFRTFFFNVCNRNDGRTWSTPFVIDDPQLFVRQAHRITSIVDRKMQQEKRRAAARNKRQNVSKKGGNRRRK